MASTQPRLRFALFLSCTIMTLALAQLSEEKLYVIRSSSPELVVDAVDKVVRLKYYTGFRTQLWKFREAGEDGLYNIINVYHGTALDILRNDSSLSDIPNHIVLRDLHSSSFQKWNVTLDGHIVNAAKNLSIDVYFGQFVTGTRLQVWTSLDLPAQFFRIEPVATAEENLWGAATLLKL